MRAFVGIDVPEPLASRLAETQTGLDIGTLVPVENLHLTLAFLGEHAEAVISDMHDILCATFEKEFELVIEGLGTFGDASPRVLYASVASEPMLTSLRRKVRRAAVDAGIELTHERFVPHITLARFGRGLQGEDVPRLQAHVARRMGQVSGSFRVTDFTLYESRLGRDGPIHTPLADYDLTPD